MFSSNKCSADQSLGVMVLIGMIRKDDFQKRLPGIHIRGTGQGRAIRPYSLQIDIGIFNSTADSVYQEREREMKGREGRRRERVREGGGEERERES